MNRVVATMALLMAACAAPAGAEEDHPDPDACKSNPIMALSDYLEMVRDVKDAKGNIQKNPATGQVIKDLPPGEYRLLVPHEMKIEKKMAHYFASEGAATAYAAPDTSIDAGWGVRFLGEIISPCRVQDPAGQWWIVYADHGALDYFKAESMEAFEPSPKKKAKP